MDKRLVSICRFCIPPEDTGTMHWLTFYIPHYRDEALLPDRRPKVRFLNNYLGFDVTARERDAAWTEAKRLGHAPLEGSDHDIIFGYYFDDRAT